MSGDYNSTQGGRGIRTVNPRTEKNLNSRSAHGGKLSEQLSIVRKEWFSTFHHRSEDLPRLPNAIPLFLQIDPDDFDPDSLKVFGIEVISEEEDGFIIGASSDIDLKSLKEKIEDFIRERGQSKNTAAKLWDIINGQHWRVDQILSQSLQEKWDKIEDETEYIINIGIACYIKIPDYPSRLKTEQDEDYQRRIKNWEARRAELSEERDDLIMVRENEVSQFVQAYNGEIKSSFIDLTDSFCCQINISGKGLKDLVFNYPYLFEVEEAESVEEAKFGAEIEPEDYQPNLIAPPPEAPKVCIIDSGIQEEHRLLELAIDKERSISKVPNEEGVADLVTDGGHGTRVASAILFPKAVPKVGDYQLPCWLQNVRVLDKNCSLNSSLYPPELMQTIVSEFHGGGTRIFNMSINVSVPCRQIHTSAWAATIDKLSWENDIVFVISTGNIYRDQVYENNPGVEHYLRTGRTYPSYLFEKSCRIANPAQSAQAIVVGSVCSQKYEDDDIESFGKHGEPSAFTRTGPGIWGMIKPDVVEFGGDYIRNKLGNPNVRVLRETCPELVRSVYGRGPAVGKDKVGTSFATPKVAHILARIQEAIPQSSTLLYRALLVQSARWPEWFDDGEYELFSILRYMGYGIPEVDLAVRNSEHRVTLVGEDVIGPVQAHVYSVKIPEELRRPGDSFSIRVEVTLSYKAIPRRTRRRTKSYLSNWLHWESSKTGETLNAFENRMLKNIDLDEPEEEDTNSFPWVIKQRRGGGVKEVNLSESTLQKDWCYIESNQLPAEFGIAVVGHKGWEKDLKAEVPYALVVSVEAAEKDIEIYERIRIENEIEVQL